MGNFTEVSQFPATVPKLETNDRVLGGGDTASANKSADVLVDRTRWLKDMNDKGLKISGFFASAFIGSPTTYNLTMANAGRYNLFVNGFVATCNLPDLQAVGSSNIFGESFIFENDGTANVEVVASNYPTVSILGSVGTGQKIIVRPLSRLIISAVYTGSSYAWVLISFTEGLRLAIPGEVKYVAFASAPNGWLHCNGAAVSRTTYADLFANIGTIYGVGDGSTTFNVPDLRADFIRGLDSGRGVDSGRGIGTFQNSTQINTATVVIGSSYYSNSAAFSDPDETANVVAGVANSASTNTAQNIPTFRVRVRNTAMFPIIKY